MNYTSHTSDSYAGHSPGTPCTSIQAGHSLPRHSTQIHPLPATPLKSIHYQPLLSLTQVSCIILCILCAMNYTSHTLASYAGHSPGIPCTFHSGRSFTPAPLHSNPSTTIHSTQIHPPPATPLKSIHYQPLLSLTPTYSHFLSEHGTHLRKCGEERDKTGYLDSGAISFSF
ncbi:hypothetical protein AVEN_183705-1 [Araneus ventricosus]|uniref:Uncharacterized protein n=1 Tax=Araneus ventricosus TaxID=182803 RepID=A0A4Y2GZT7_ARAVE|nr:hypothetical protein AVEN_183705-1 [Araneus ventricosus]